jgi:hypothetical protein
VGRERLTDGPHLVATQGEEVDDRRAGWVGGPKG